MAETGGTYLPPVIASLVGEVGDLAKTLIEGKALLDEFAQTSTTVDIKAELTSLPMLQLELFKDIASLDVIAKAHPVGVPMQLDMFSIISDTTAARLFIDKAINTPPVKAKIVPDVDWASFLSVRAILATFFSSIGGRIGGAGAALGGAGRGAGGVPGALGFGTAGFGAGAFGLAAFGTPAALAGFGLERVLTIALGLIGSMSQAFAGLGVIAAGTFATMAVGMGSDMAVMKSVITDTQALYKLWTNLQDAVLIYGANSQQAQDATTALNNQLKILGNTAGVQAELGLAKLAFTINQQWDKATSAARVQAVALLTQILLLGQTYIPLVAEAARRNLSIINTALVPLFTWLKGPQGMGIFNDLETKFERDLPTAMDAFTKGIEFLLRFLDLASNYTGGFIQMLDRLFTYLNSSAGFERVRRDVALVIGVFDVWKGFIIILGKDLGLLLGQTVGVGTTMVQMLTGILTKLHDYLESTSGKQAIGSLFQAHKAEIVALLQALPKLAGPIAQIYLKLAVPLTNIATAIVNIINALISIPGAGPVLAYAMAFAFMAGQLRLAAMWSVIWTIATKLATAAQIAFDIALDANVIAIIILAIAALIIIIVLLITHWKDVTKTVQGVWKDVTHWVGQIVSDVGKFFSNLGTMVEKVWSEFAKRPGYWIGYLIGFVIGSLIKLQLDMGKKFDEIVGKVVAWGASMAAKAPGAMSQLINAIMTEANKLPGQFESIGNQIVQGIINGIKNLLPWAQQQLTSFFQGLYQGAKNAIGSSSPSKRYAELGASIPQGLAMGVHANTSTALAALVSMFDQMSTRGQMMTRPGAFGASALARGGGSMRGGVSINAPVTVQVSGASAATPQGIGDAVQRSIAKEFDRLVQQLQGGVYSIPGT